MIWADTWSSGHTPWFYLHDHREGMRKSYKGRYTRGHNPPSQGGGSSRKSLLQFPVDSFPDKVFVLILFLGLTMGLLVYIHEK